MVILKCPACGVWPATEVTIPVGRDCAGLTTVRRLVRCPGCGKTVQGDPRARDFQAALQAWKAVLEEQGES